MDGEKPELRMPERGPAPRFTYPEAAEILRLNEKFLRNSIKKIPHSKKGQTVTFSMADLNAIDAMYHHEPPSREVSYPGQELAMSDALARLKPLPSRRRRRSGSENW
jgi:hypothetical protein